jgi:hypothetical protein
MYALLWATGRGIDNFVWCWLVLAVLLDLSHWAASARGAYEDRERIPGYAVVCGARRIGGRLP